jgi:hypothetical protein
MLNFDIRYGIHFEDAVRQMLFLANDRNTSVQTEFYDIVFVVNPGDEFDQIIESFALKLRRDSIEYVRDLLPDTYQKEGFTTLEVVCVDCDGSGVYRVRSNGIGIICRTCGGVGKTYLTYRPFVKRIIRHDVKEVCLLYGKDAPIGDTVPYDEFLKGEIP